MKKVLLIITLLLSVLSCSKVGPDANRYYVKYEIDAYSGRANASMSFSYTLLDNNNQYVSGAYGSKTGYSQTYGPVSKGFESYLEAYMNITYGSKVGQPVKIYVAINEEPFTLKASGQGKISYKIK